MKVCRKCQEEKDLTEFYEGRSQCKACLHKAARERGRAGGDRRDYETKRAKLRALKADGCVLCREMEPVCLDFHHLNPAEKEYNPSEMLSLSYERLKAEVAKCVVLCKNCHAKVHAGLLEVSHVSLS